MIRTLTALAEQSRDERSRMTLEQLMSGYAKAKQRLVILQAMRGPKMIIDSCVHSVAGYNSEINSRVSSISEGAVREESKRTVAWNAHSAVLAQRGA